MCIHTHPLILTHMHSLTQLHIQVKHVYMPNCTAGHVETCSVLSGHNLGFSSEHETLDPQVFPPTSPQGAPPFCIQWDCLYFFVYILFFYTFFCVFLLGDVMFLCYYLKVETYLGVSIDQGNPLFPGR